MQIDPALLSALSALVGALTAMSALGQKQTFGQQIAMSALPPKADIRERTNLKGNSEKLSVFGISWPACQILMAPREVSRSSDRAGRPHPQAFGYNK